MTTVKLSKPVEHGGKTYTTLTFRKAKTGDLMLLDKFEGETSKMIALLAAVSDTPIQAFKEIEIEDFNALVAVAGEVLGESLPSKDSGSM